MGDGTEHIDYRIFFPQYICPGGYFKTFVFQFTQVIPIAFETGRKRQGNTAYQILGPFKIIAGVQRNQIVQETGFQIDIKGPGLFPLQVGITHCTHNGTQPSGIPLSFVVVVYILGFIRFERSLTQATDIGRNLKTAHYTFAAFPKGFIVDVPTNTQRTEWRIFLIITELRRAVQTTGEIQHINIIVRIVHIKKSTRQTRHTLFSGRNLVLISITERDVVHISGGETNHTVRFIFIAGFLHIGS